MAKARGSLGSMSSINVTPLTDVLLVLLITFLLTATAFQGGQEQVPLPRIADAKELAEQATVIGVALSGKPLWPDSGSTDATMQERFSQLKGSSEKSVLALAVHRELTYELLYPVLIAAEQAGWSQIVLLTESPK